MFNKKKKPTPEQQIASLAEIYQAQISQTLQLRDPVERFERLGEISMAIITSNEGFNKGNSNTAGLVKAVLVTGGITGGIGAAVLLANPLTGIFTIAASGLYFVREIHRTEAANERKDNNPLSSLCAMIYAEQKTILAETPLESMQLSPKFKEFVAKHPSLKERITAEFLRVTAHDYKKPLKGKEKLPKNDIKFNG